MADLATAVPVIPASPSLHERGLKKKSSRAGAWIFSLAVVAGLGYIGVHVAKDLDHVTVPSIWPYFLLGLALAIALGFEFVNGFHDTANAVATVIYTNSLAPNIGRGLVGVVQLCRRAAFVGNGGVCGHLAAAGGADSEGEFRALGSRWSSRC